MSCPYIIKVVLSPDAVAVDAHESVLFCTPCDKSEESETPLATQVQKDAAYLSLGWDYANIRSMCRLRDIK